MRDVAGMAGVSITTVSHIVNETRAVAPLTREKVLRAMRELKFHRNAYGRRLARGHSDSYGLIISDVENPFFPELIKSFEDFVMERGCDVLLCATNYDPERSRKAVARMIENKVLGVAVVTAQIGVGLIEELTDADIPVFRVDAAEPPGRCLSNVRVDYSTGAKEAVAHLKALGHRDIAYIAGPRTRTSAVTCRQAFSDALQSLRLPRPRTVEVNNDMDGGAAAARTLLDGSELPTAIICCNDLAALGAMRALLEAGVRVPRDVSILGVDDISFARYATPALTTVRVPRDRLGHLAFEGLERMVRSKRRAGSQYSLETSLVVRQSTGAVRSKADSPKPGAKRKRAAAP
jgi:DNA-binding LacI/PurR family transcriptional regulator